MPFSHAIEVRFRDLDALGHVNNAVLVTYLEVARFAWWRGFLSGRDFQEEGFLIARLEVDYRRPILPGETVMVELRCSRLGRSSFDLAYRVLYRTGTVLAEARSVQVMVDFADGRPAPLGESARSWLEGQA